MAKLAKPKKGPRTLVCLLSAVKRQNEILDERTPGLPKGARKALAHHGEPRLQIDGRLKPRTVA